MICRSKNFHLLPLLTTGIVNKTIKINQYVVRLGKLEEHLKIAWNGGLKEIHFSIREILDILLMTFHGIYVETLSD